MPEFNSKKIKYMFLLLVSITFLFFLINELGKDITGMLIAGVDVGSKTRVRVTSFDYPVYPDFGQFVNVTIEVQNSGSVGYDEKIEVFVKNSTMDQVAYYYDAVTHLNPGERKSFRFIYLPPDYGVYYMQLRVSYAETKRLETWGVIVVSPQGYGDQTDETSETGTETEGNVVYIGYQTSEGGYLGGEIIPLEMSGSVHRMEIDAPRNLELSKGESRVTYVDVSNSGNSTLHNLKLTTYTHNIDVDVFPKFLVKFPPKTSNVFMISIKVPTDIEPNLYSLDMEFSSDEIDVVKKMILNITDLSLKEVAYENMINYKYVLAELEKQVLNALEQGLEVSEIKTRLDFLKGRMEDIENYYEEGSYTTVSRELDEIRPEIQTLLLDFAIVNIPEKEPVFFRASNVILWIIVALISLVVVLAYKYLKSKKEVKRPKLLEELSERIPE